jgi:hypothetical protein
MMVAAAELRRPSSHLKGDAGCRKAA